MSPKSFIIISLQLFLTFSLVHVGSFSSEAAVEFKDLLPPVTCGAGWNVEGRSLIYDRETLSDRINGEAELYFPYGFDRMVAARYVSEKNTGVGIDVEIYRMGSHLDAFGIYANYRQKEGRSLDVGAASNFSASQLFLYKANHFIHIQVTGAEVDNSDALRQCARTVASRIPGNNSAPAELLVLDRPEFVKGTERYLPQSLLGYDFLNRGIITDAVIEGANLQIFFLLNTTIKSASAAFNHFRSQLSQTKTVPLGKGTVFLEGVDSLYGPVIILKKDDCLAGALKFNGDKGIRALLESVCRR